METRAVPRFLRLTIFKVRYVALIVLCYMLLKHYTQSYKHKMKQPVEVSTKVYDLHRQEDWQSVGHPQYPNFKIYSAYSSNDQEVVIIGTPTPFKKATEQLVQCSFYWNSAQIPGSVKTTAILTSHKWYVPSVSGTFIRCPLPQNRNPRPDFAGVLLGNQTSSSVRLPIQYRIPHESGQYLHNFSVCVLPLYEYNQVFHFIEWVEFYKMMGVDHFTFYNRTIGPATSCVMNHLENSSNGIAVKIYPWQTYPQMKESDKERGRKGVSISAGANDCVYRHRGLSKYMVFLDVDEFIVPLKRIQNYHQLINYLNNIPSGGAKYGEYLFQNAFYLKSRSKDFLLSDRCSELRNEEYQTCEQLWTMQYVEREPLRSWKSRTKPIIVPEGVKELGNHYAFTFEKGWKSLKVNGSIAFHRHYRYFKEQSNETTIERMPDGMGTLLAKNVARSVKYFMKVCNFNEANLFQETN